MTAAASLLARLRDAGAEVRVRDGKPILHAPVALPPDLLAEARAHRAEVMAGLLAANDAGPTATCCDCGARGWWGPAAPEPPAAGWGCWGCQTDACGAARFDPRRGCRQ